MPNRLRLLSGKKVRRPLSVPAGTRKMMHRRPYAILCVVALRLAEVQHRLVRHVRNRANEPPAGDLQVDLHRTPIAEAVDSPEERFDFGALRFIERAAERAGGQASFHPQSIAHGTVSEAIQQELQHPRVDLVRLEVIKELRLDVLDGQVGELEAEVELAAEEQIGRAS